MKFAKQKKIENYKKKSKINKQSKTRRKQIISQRFD
jgi:hypothetical protein